MLKICLVFWESEPQYAYKRYVGFHYVLPSSELCIFSHENLKTSSTLKDEQGLVWASMLSSVLIHKPRHNLTNSGKLEDERRKGE